MSEQQMKVFARLAKVDEAKRLITGVLVNEAIDYAGEVFDYETSKPYFKAWSDTVQKATNGASVGNLRAQHGQVVAGKLEEMVFDDVAKSITITANVVDDNEWKKVLANCYTGFSVGGKYINKWDDTALGKKRYTGNPSEASIVDLACNPEASFTFVKAAGGEELRKFASPADAVDAVIAATPTRNDIVADLRKQLGELPSDTPESLRKAIDEMLGVAETQLSDNREINARLLKCVGEALAKRVADKDENTLALLASASTFSKDDELKKGLYDASRICDLLCSLGWVTDSVASEAMFENDGSGVPAQLVGVMRQLGQALVALVQEEVAEMLVNYEGDAMATAVPTGDLKKDGGEAAAATPTNDNDTLLKSFGDLLTKQLEPLTKQNDDLKKSVESLSTKVTEQGTEIAALKKATPAPGGARLHVVNKEDELKKDHGSAEDNAVKPILGNDGKQDDVATLIKQAHANGGEPLLKAR
jgi:hypothetical protein